MFISVEKCFMGIENKILLKPVRMSFPVVQMNEMLN